MEHATYASRLRYLDADDVEDSTLDFSGMDVRASDGSKLGDIEGFIIESTTGRVYHVVVDSGGWFTSRRFLLPIGHAQLDLQDRVLRVDAPRDSLRSYPEFDERRFEAFTDDELRAFEQRTAAACCPDESLRDASAGTWGYDHLRHFAQPAWWTGSARTHERARSVSAGPPATAIREQYDRELVTARERDRDLRDDRIPRGQPTDDTSPHFEGRAQPGDVLGLETGGERTYIGDMSEDEDKRRRTSEKAVRDDDVPPRRSDR
jgi:hypothetical protein